MNFCSTMHSYPSLASSSDNRPRDVGALKQEKLPPANGIIQWEKFDLLLYVLSLQTAQKGTSSIRPGWP